MTPTPTAHGQVPVDEVHAWSLNRTRAIRNRIAACQRVVDAWEPRACPKGFR